MARTVVLVLTIVLSIISWSVRPVFAQEESTLDRLKKDYFFQIEAYNKALSDFDLKRAEYNQIGTLVSREQAVASFKQVMYSQVSILQAYLTVLEQILSNELLVDPLEKQKAISRIQTNRNFLSEHKKTIESPTLPSDINIVADNLSSASSEIFAAIYTVHSLLAISRVEVVYTKLQLYSQEFEQNQLAALVDQQKRDFLLRGLKDIKNQTNLAGETISKAKTYYNELYPHTVEGKTVVASGQETYTQVVNALQPTYGYVNKSIQYLLELDRQAK